MKLKAIVACLIAYANLHLTEAGRGHNHDHHRPVSNLEPFAQLLKITESKSSKGVDLSATERLLSGLSETCLTAEKLFRFLSLQPGSVIRKESFLNAALIISNFASRSECVEFTAREAFTEAYSLLDQMKLCRATLELMILDMLTSGRVRSGNTTELQRCLNTQCFATSDLLSANCTMNHQRMTRGFATMFGRLLTGSCFLPSPSYFVDAAFRGLGADLAGLSRQKFSHLLHRLNIGSRHRSGEQDPSEEDLHNEDHHGHDYGEDDRDDIEHEHDIDHEYDHDNSEYEDDDPGIDEKDDHDEIDHENQDDDFEREDDNHEIVHDDYNLDGDHGDDDHDRVTEIEDDHDEIDDKSHHDDVVPEDDNHEIIDDGYNSDDDHDMVTETEDDHDIHHEVAHDDLHHGDVDDDHEAVDTVNYESDSQRNTSKFHHENSTNENFDHENDQLHVTDEENNVDLHHEIDSDDEERDTDDTDDENPDRDDDERKGDDADDDDVIDDGANREFNDPGANDLATGDRVEADDADNDRGNDNVDENRSTGEIDNNEDDVGFHGDRNATTDGNHRENATETVRSRNNNDAVDDRNQDVDLENGNNTILSRNRRSAGVHVDSFVNCYTAKEMIRIAWDGPSSSGHDDAKGVTKAGFRSLCPVLLHQIFSKVCQETADTADDGSHDEDVSSSGYTTQKKYIYATSAFLTLSTLSIICLVLMKERPAEDWRKTTLTMQFFIALAIGTLSGDALLHLLPEVIGLHGHHGHHGHARQQTVDTKEHNIESNAHIWKMLAVLGGIYVCYLFENGTNLWIQISRIRKSKAGDLERANESDIAVSEDGVRNRTETAIQVAVTNFNCASEIIASDHSAASPVASKSNESQFEEMPSSDNKSEIVCMGVTPIGIMVLIGDVLHNFGDGIALGAAFSVGWVSGISTAIALFCHEVPHELGGFSIYLKHGIPKWKAILLNVSADVCGLVGVYIGLGVSERGDAPEWLLAIMAGMFLYLSLADIMHETLIEATSARNPTLQFAVQNVGLVLGWAALTAVALYEGKIDEALQW